VVEQVHLKNFLLLFVDLEIFVVTFIYIINKEVVILFLNIMHIFSSYDLLMIFMVLCIDLKFKLHFMILYFMIL
jgi:hypothetical protein